MRRLHLFVPHLSLGLARARRSESFPPGPLVLGGRPWDPGPVIDASPDARALGVRRGMPLGSAHRLVPEATFIEPDLDADRAVAEAVFEALARYSPSLAGSVDPTVAAFGQFELGIDGLAPLWGPEPTLVERVSSALRAALPEDGPGVERGPGHPSAFDPRAGIAGTHFAATLAASHARPGSPVVVPPGTEPAFLADFPSGLLTTDPDVRARLARFGLRHIGAVAELPRSALIARFGDEGSRLHARARGEETDRFHARHAPERLALALPIEPPVEGLESVRFVLHRLVAALAAHLTARGLAADRAILTLELDPAFAPAGTPPRVAVEQRFPEPTADAAAVERLLFARLEREPPAAAVGRLDLELRGTVPAAGQQLPLFVPQAARTATLGWQLARLALTYGEDRIRRVVVTDPEAPLPERRWAWRSVGLGGDEGVARPPTIARRTRR
jgi:nucleotidyltransferase/DNA polymerase involved in DNA repair